MPNLLTTEGRLNLDPWVSRCVIKDKDAKLGPIDLNGEFAWAQRVLIKEIERQHRLNKPIRTIVLKGRQLGISTCTEAVLFSWCFMFPGTNHLVLSKSREDSEMLFEMTKLMWDTSWFKPMFTPTRSSAKRLSWAETLSNFRVATAKGADVGRGATLHGVHGSEVAFWDDAEDIMTSMGPALPYKPGTIVVLESTANGVGGFFYDEWQKASRGESDYVPLFFPWWKHHEYQIPRSSLRVRDLNGDELEMLEQGVLLNGRRYKLTINQLAWRRRAIMNEFRGDPEMFQQEYPNNPEEAFLSTGRNVFDLGHLYQCYDPDVQRARGILELHQGKIKFYPDSTGSLTVFKRPDRYGRQEYVLGADCARTNYGDPACIQVLNRVTKEQVAIWRGHVTPNELAEIIDVLGRWYNEAVVNIEIEGGGAAAIAVLQHLNYPNLWRWRWPDRPIHKLGSSAYGWSTNGRTKPWMISNMQHMLRSNALLLHDTSTYQELREYTHTDWGEMRPASTEGHDDTVMALGVAIMADVESPPVDYERAFAGSLISAQRQQTVHAESQPWELAYEGYREIE
jgi:hypothetical protein